jgi:hypothetical protein
MKINGNALIRHPEIRPQSRTEHHEHLHVLDDEHV